MGTLGQKENPKVVPIPPRFKRVLSIILKENPDVITLQELDHYHDFMKPELEKLGYEGDFKNKPSSPAEKWNGGIRDGVSIFWNTQRLEQLGTSRKFNLANHEAKPSGQVAMYVLLRNKATAEVFAVVTSHMKSGTKPKDVAMKNSQSTFMGQMINTLGVPVIFACDFNANPSREAYQTFHQAAPNMKSAYAEVLGVEPKFTTAKWRKGGVQKEKCKKILETIDFIFYSGDDWKCSGVLKIPTEGKLETLLLPGWKYPSGHFCIAADLEFVDKTKSESAAKSDRRSNSARRLRHERRGLMSRLLKAE